MSAVVLLFFIIMKVVDEIFDEHAAARMGIDTIGQVTVMGA